MVCVAQDFNPRNLCEGNVFCFNGGYRELVLSVGKKSVKTLSPVGQLGLATTQRRFFGAYEFLHDDVIRWPRSDCSVLVHSPSDNDYEALVNNWRGVEL